MHRKGIALVATLAVLVVLAILAFGTFFTTQLEIWTTRNDVTANQAYAAAHAGIQKYKTAAFQAFRYYLANPSLYATGLAAYSQCGNLLSIGLDLNRDGDVNDPEDLPVGGQKTETVPFPDGTTGTYTISLGINGKYLVLRSVGTYRGAQATVTAVAEVASAGLFSNAVAAGYTGGAAGPSIAGNASIWGGIYINASGTSVNDFVLGSAGDVEVHNFYTRSQLADFFGNQWSETQISQFLKLQAMEQRDMCAAIRVTGGKIKLWGNTTIGDQSLPQGLSSDGGWNRLVDGIYVGSGTTGGQNCNNYSNNSPDVCVGGNATLYTQRGINAFDLQNPPSIPRLDGPCTTPGKTWRECLRESAANSGLVVQKQGSTLTLDPSVTCNLTTLLSGNTLTFGQTPIACLTATNPPRGFIYTYDPATRKGQLQVYGVVNFRGLNVVFAEDVEVRYTNKATLFVEKLNNQGGNVTLDGHLLPGNSFPDQDVLGIIAEENLTITGDTQNITGSPQRQVVIGLFYAGNTLNAGVNATVFGTAIGKQVCVNNCNPGGGSARFIQVPGLEFNLPPGFSLIPNATSATFSQLTYERR
ncbi:hypothetical protein [Thermus thalpophilus]|uniref:hypothetical protein n=1 Tax=Thermus thalpophilus TaxID=2908147 RepID=UPI001FAAD00F|nr:hypothetical protein [Thermus thalpophilus]